MKGVILVAAALFLASASASAATASATAKQYGFPASWVAKERASLISSTGNHSIRCHGEVRVFMRAGGNGYKRIVCVGNDTRYTFTIDRTGHVQVAAVVALASRRSSCRTFSISRTESVTFGNRRLDPCRKGSRVSARSSPFWPFRVGPSPRYSRTIDLFEREAE